MTSQIHDLGYEAYRGPRMPPSRRFLVIARNVFAVAWQSRWGVKVPLIYAVAVTLAASVVMYVVRDRLFEMVRERGAPIPRAEQIIFFAWTFLRLAGYILAAIVACAAVANDLRMGAFQFYFSRPLRPRDYVLGKLLGVTLVVGVPMFCGPVLLGLVRLLFADSLGQATQLLPILPRAGLLGILGTAALSLPAMALGAVLAKRQPAQALFVVYFVVLSTAAIAMAEFLHVPELSLLSIGADVEIIGRALFGVARETWQPDPWLAGGTLAVICGSSLAAIWWRVARAETASLGGG
jgi:hypothetical protein